MLTVVKELEESKLAICLAIAGFSATFNILIRPCLCNDDLVGLFKCNRPAIHAFILSFKLKGCRNIRRNNGKDRRQNKRTENSFKYHAIQKEIFHALFSIQIGKCVT